MQLQYRGVNYEAQPTVSPASAASAPVADLKYRGATYRGSQALHAENLNTIMKNRVAADEAQPAQVTDKMRSLIVHHQQLIKTRQQAMLSRSAAEVGLPTEASHYWNRIQGKIHPTFRQNYDRSLAAFS